MTLYQMEHTAGTSSAWAASTVALGPAELGYDTTLKKVKAGDGSSLWSGIAFLGEDPNILNPKNFGAKGDGTTDDSAAFLAMFNAVIASSRNDFSSHGDYRLTKSIFIPPGTYMITSNAQLIADVAMTFSSGLFFDGSGLDVSTIVFNPAAANGYLFFNNDKLYRIRMSGLSFHVTGTNAASATLFKSVSNGHAQSYTFEDCLFSGTAKYGLALSGSNNNSEMKFTNSKFHMSHPSGAFLYSPSVGSGGSDQFLNYQFENCDVEVSGPGDFVQMATGGCVNIKGSSLIHMGDGNQTTSTQQRFVSMLGTSHSAASDSVSIRDCRVEHHHNNSQLLYSERVRGNIVVDNINSEAFAGWAGNLSAPQNVKQIEIVGGSQSYPNVRVSNSMLMGKQVYHYNSSSYTARPNIEYDNCNFVDAVVQGKRAVDYFTFTADGGTTNVAGAPVIRVKNCHAEADTDNNEIFDTSLNWHTAINQPVESRTEYFRAAAGGPASGATVHLPPNSLITGFTVSKGSGGTATGTNVVYTLTNGDGTTVGTITGSGGVAWNTAWRNNAGQLGFLCTTDNQRSLTVTFTNITETRADLMLGVIFHG